MAIGAGCLAVLVAALGLSACGDSGSDDSGPKTFEQDGYPFTFEYPASFRIVQRRHHGYAARVLGGRDYGRRDR